MDMKLLEVTGPCNRWVRYLHRQDLWILSGKLLMDFGISYCERSKHRESTLKEQKRYLVSAT